MVIPACGCIESYTKEAKLTAIYCVLYSAITNPVNLPSCECVSNRTEAAKLDAIYCALLQFTTQPFSGTIEPSQIEGITPFGEAMLTASPGNNMIIGTDGAGVFTLLPYSGFGSQLVNMFTPDPDQVLGTDSGGLPTSYAIGGVGSQILAFNSAGVDSIVTVDSGGVADLSTGPIAAQMIAGTATFTGTQSPVNSIDISNGIVTTVS